MWLRLRLRACKWRPSSGRATPAVRDADVAAGTWSHPEGSTRARHCVAPRRLATDGPDANATWTAVDPGPMEESAGSRFLTSAVILKLAAGRGRRKNQLGLLT